MQVVVKMNEAMCIDCLETGVMQKVSRHDPID